jgi:hypothetical protein
VEVAVGEDLRSFGSWQAVKTIKIEQRPTRFRNRIDWALASEWFDQDAFCHPKVVSIAEEQAGSP